MTEIAERVARIESVVDRQTTVLDRIEERLRCVEARVAESRPVSAGMSTILAGVITAILLRMLLGC